MKLRSALPPPPRSVQRCLVVSRPLQVSRVPTPRRPPGLPALGLAPFLRAGSPLGSVSPRSTHLPNDSAVVTESPRSAGCSPLVPDPTPGALWSGPLLPRPLGARARHSVLPRPPGEGLGAGTRPRLPPPRTSYPRRGARHGRGICIVVAFPRPTPFSVTRARDNCHVSAAIL